MYEIILSKSAKNQLIRLDKSSQEKIIYSLERIRIKPEKHIRKVIGDSSYKLKTEKNKIYLDVNKKSLFVLLIKGDGDE